MSVLKKKVSIKIKVSIIVAKLFSLWEVVNGFVELKHVKNGNLRLIQKYNDDFWC